MSGNVLTHNDFLKALDENRVKVGEFLPKRNFAPITIDGDAFLLQVPKMVTPFGSNPSFKPNPNSIIDPNANYCMDLAFHDEENRKSLQKFHESLDKLSDIVIKKAVTRSEHWFGGKCLDESLVTSWFKPNIRNSNSLYPPCFRITLRRKNGAYTFAVCDKDMNPIKLEEINTKNAEVVAIVKCAGVWKIGKSFGITFIAEQLLIIPPKTNADITKQTLSFRTDTDDEVKKDENSSESIDPEYSDPTDENNWGSKKKDPMKNT